MTSRTPAARTAGLPRPRARPSLASSKLKAAATTPAPVSAPAPVQAPVSVPVPAQAQAPVSAPVPAQAPVSAPVPAQVPTSVSTQAKPPAATRVPVARSVTKTSVAPRSIVINSEEEFKGATLEHQQWEIMAKLAGIEKMMLDLTAKVDGVMSAIQGTRNDVTDLSRKASAPSSAPRPVKAQRQKTLQSLLGDLLMKHIKGPKANDNEIYGKIEDHVPADVLDEFMKYYHEHQQHEFRTPSGNPSYSAAAKYLATKLSQETVAKINQFLLGLSQATSARYVFLEPEDASKVEVGALPEDEST
jgi:hypothetical protein